MSVVVEVEMPGPTVLDVVTPAEVIVLITLDGKRRAYPGARTYPSPTLHPASN